VITYPLGQAIDATGPEVLLNDDAASGFYPSDQLTHGPRGHLPVHPDHPSGILWSGLIRVEGWDARPCLHPNLLKHLVGAKPVDVEPRFELPPRFCWGGPLTSHMGIYCHGPAQVVSA
jgi:hypothetical protein